MSEFPKLDYIFQTPDQNPSWSLMDGMEKGIKPFFQACLQGSGAMPETALSIMDGSIVPSVSYNAVDTEGEASIDELETIETTQSNDGMELYLRAANKDRQVLVKHSHVLNGISLAEGKDIYLTPDAYLKLKRNGSKWVEVRGLSLVSDSVTNDDSGVAASSRAVKMAYDKADDAYIKAARSVPLPLTSEGYALGHWQSHLIKAGGSFAVPPGGTWMVFLMQTQGGAIVCNPDGYLPVFLSAGGRTFTPKSTYYSYVVLWRIK